MQCFECMENGESNEAVGLCHHCSAALCQQHALTTEEFVTTIAPLLRTVVLPKRARLILCATCKTALEQTGSRRVFALV